MLYNGYVLSASRHGKNKNQLSNMRPPHRYKRRPRNPDQAGLIRFVLVLGLLAVTTMAFRSVIGHALPATSPINSGLSGYCLDVRHDDSAANAEADSWRCNGSQAQAWVIDGDMIKHGNSCLTVQNNGTTAGDNVVLDSCQAAAGQVWLRDRQGYENPNGGLCLAVPNAVTGVPLVVASCAALSQPNETWTPTVSKTRDDSAGAAANCAAGAEGQRVACDAEQAWTVWQSGSPSHEALLNSYTDGAPYEAWCADFVSYVYKEAGYPFSGGETNGWDENLAGNIQNMGFTKHDAAGYVPQAGDVAYFDYPGGHVEIVISGGKQPTFVYGDSATIDPSTGNGDMEANTITQDGPEGHVLYYLSPDNGS